MQFRSIGDLSRAVSLGAWKVPADVDLIVGIPRSGLLAGSILALHLNLPIVDLGGYLAGNAPRIGRTSEHTVRQSRKGRRKVLVIDDTIDTGASIARVREEIGSASLDDEILFGAIYGAKDHHEGVDIIFEAVETPRLFEWNLMRHKRITDACFDIDGVLCHDPPHSDNDDGPRYKAFVSNARPLLIPKLPVAHLVTSRLERYRPQTEAWLEEAGVSYGKLWMLDLPSAEERRRLKAHGSFKAKIYRECGASLFIESEDIQAEEIARLSEKPVLSIEGQRIVWPDDPAANRRHRKAAGWHSPRKRSRPAAIIAALLGERRYLQLRAAIKGN